MVNHQRFVYIFRSTGRVGPKILKYIERFFLFYSINLMCINFYFELILINKFIKHNQVNNSYCDIKYLDFFCHSLFLMLFLFKKNVIKPKMDFLRCLFSLFFFIELDYFSYFFSHIVKNIILKKIYLLNFIKSMDIFHRFCWLTWFADLMSLIFF